MCMEISDLQREHIFYKEHLFEVPVFSPLCDPLGVVLQAVKWLEYWKQKEE